MNIQTFESEKALAEAASRHIIEAIQQQPNLLLCTATGSTPTLSYQHVVSQREQFPYDQLRILKLDEWGGIPIEHPGTCESYLHQHLLQPLNISSERYFSFQSNPPDPEQECKRMHQILQREGPIDLCILGIGVNGHLAFNEPGNFLHPHCHVAKLSSSSLQHQMAKDMQDAQLYGLTLGMQDILASKAILLLISGQSKLEVAMRLLQGKISTQLPASFLWLHNNVQVFIH